VYIYRDRQEKNKEPLHTYIHTHIIVTHGQT
jgi:hypothetical protein